MKIFLSLFLIFFLSCNSAQKTTQANSSSSVETTQVGIENKCPKGVVCEFDVLKNKSLKVMTDGIGMQYPKLVDSKTSSVIKYRYFREAPNGMMDGNYTEEVYFEVENDVNSLDLSGKELQQVKLLYGRRCYCKGSTGYFKVTEGNLKFERQNNGATAYVSFEFENNEVPQKIEKVEATVSYKK